MKSFFLYLWIQFKMDLRNKGTLLTYYFTPLLFFFAMGSVFASTSPLMKSTLAASMTIFAVTMGAIMGIPGPLVNLRQSGALRAFRATGIPGLATLGVSAVSAFLHLLIVSCVIYTGSILAFGADVPLSFSLYFCVLAVFLFTSIGIGLFIGVCARGQSYATMISMLVFMPSLLLSGIMFPASLLPEALVKAGFLFPASHALSAFYGFAYNMPTTLSPILSLLIVAGFGVLFHALAAWRLLKINKSEQG